MNTLAPPATAADMPTLDDFCDRVCSTNPFTDNRVNGPAPDDVDVGAIHQTAFARLIELAREARDQARGLGVVLWGEAGIGKSHLLSRLARWAAEDRQACYVYLHNLSASPENLPRTILKGVVSILTAGRLRALHQTPLFQLVLAALDAALGRNRSVTHPWPKAQAAYEALIDRLTAGRPERATTVDRRVYDVLFRFFQSACRLRRGKHDPTAELAVRWLRGDALDPDEGRLLGLPPGLHRDDSVVLADNQEVKQVLVALTQLALWRGQPFVLCFDQVDNLDVDQAAALARFLEAVIDTAPNLLVVTAGIQATLLRWRDDKVFQDSAWDRLAQFQVPLLRIDPLTGRHLIEARLERFLEPFVTVDAVRHWLQEDHLFPLGQSWAEAFFQGKIDIRPRDVINGAREGWRQEQDRLREQGGNRWLASWGQRQPPSNGTGREPPTPELIEAAIDRKVDRMLAELKEQRRQQPETLPWDASTVAGLVYKLLEQYRQVVPGSGLRGLERPAPPSPNRRPTYDLLIRHRSNPEGPEVCSGVLVLQAAHGNAITAALRHLFDDAEPPERVFLIADEREPPRFAPKGREYRDQLRQRGAPRFQEIALTFDEYASLDALQGVVGLARAGDLEIELPPGQSRPVSAEEVIASHHRQGRYRSAAILRELLAASV